MKYLSLFCLVILASCAHERAPASLNGNPVAYDSMALGNVKGSAVKRVENQDVCFDINMVMTGIKQEQALASNWSFAWVDQQGQYHLLNQNQRNPASLPQGGQQIAPYGQFQEWTNNFTACAPKARANDVKTLVVTPKDLPYEKKDGLQFNWQ